MAPWLLQALRLLAAGFGGGLAFETGQRAIGSGDERGGGPIPGPSFFGIPGLLGGDKPKRRRRRRALTASDKADIAFIVGLLGPGAGKQFSTTLAARPR